VARRLPADFEGKEMEALAVAARSDDAQKIEAALDAADIEYTFEITELVQQSVLGILFGAVKEGVMFLVPASHYEFSKTALRDAGLSRLLVDEGQPS
jgi:hypothetical protein